VFVTSIKAVCLGSCVSLGVVYVRGPSFIIFVSIARALGMLRSEADAFVRRNRDLSVCIYMSLEFLLSESNSVMFCKISSTRNRHV
jgi:hypothetical protein